MYTLNGGIHQQTHAVHSEVQESRGCPLDPNRMAETVADWSV